MADYNTILYRLDGPVCRITMNRPEKRNAINREMAEELTRAFAEVRKEVGVGVVVLAGEGKSFCTGGDLEIFPSLGTHDNCLNWLAHEGMDLQRAMANCNKVIVGRLHGHCLAGGLELALCCDLLYACESTKFGTTEIDMGILPGWGGTVRLPRSMPVFRAREIIYSGRKDYTARDMYDMGLLTRVFPDDVFETEFGKIIDNLSRKKPIALRMAKEIMDKAMDGTSLETALAVERNGITWLVYAPDIQSLLNPPKA
jgi:enoyl-CoA hydratase/carnithine racemase